MLVAICVGLGALAQTGVAGGQRTTGQHVDARVGDLEIHASDHERLPYMLPTSIAVTPCRAIAQAGAARGIWGRKSQWSAKVNPT